jgi:hypothetical protein
VPSFSCAGLLSTRLFFLMEVSLSTQLSLVYSCLGYLHLLFPLVNGYLSRTMFLYLVLLCAPFP